MPRVKSQPHETARVTTVTGAEQPVAASRYAGGTRQHHIQVIVSRPVFYENILYLRKTIAPSKICVVLKSNAYGHGLAALVPVAVAAGADYLGVCSNPEAAAVRQLGIDVPLLRLRMALPEELDESAADLEMDEQVGTWEQAEYLSTLGRKRRRKMPVHINIDTGMGRSGFFVEQADLIRKVCGLPGLRIRGVFTHFAKSDAADLEPTAKSLDSFDQLCKQLSSALPDDVLIHTHNSAATVRLAERRRHLVRVGAACFGVRTSQDFLNPTALRPVMSVKTRVAQVREIPAGKTIGYGGLFTTQRDSQIVSLPVGFGEGYPRALFNKGEVLIHGRRCSVVGRVSLNIVTVDVTDLDKPVRWGDEVVLVGRQGDEEITFEHLADKFASVHTEINLMAGSMNDVEYV
ncbi:MAG TPA: alanine racemase [Pirellulales bacterium]|jgi:alanine racemase|nr:alanine racemase [Pirellulales bacterium]